MRAVGSLKSLGTAEKPATDVLVRLGPVAYRAVMRTDVGRRRTENQDSYGYALGKETGLFIVADGMGGARGGGTASAMAVNLILDGSMGAQHVLDHQLLERSIAASNHVIFSRAQEDQQLSGMGTTVVALAFVKNRAIVAHVGDSRVYRLRGGEFSQLTRDHTLVQELVDSGAIQPEDAATHPIAHMLTRSLGPMAAIGVEVKTLDEEVAVGDRYLLCSDGLYNHCPKEAMLRALSGKKIESAADAMLSLALENGGTDNVTLQIIEVLSPDAAAAGRAGDDRLVSSEIDVSLIGGMPLREYADSLRSSAGAAAAETAGAASGRTEPARAESARVEASPAEVPRGGTAATGRKGEGARGTETKVSHAGRAAAARDSGIAKDDLIQRNETPLHDEAEVPALERELDDFLTSSHDPFDGGSFDSGSFGGAEDHSHGHRYSGAALSANDFDIDVPRWWTSFVAGILTFVFAGVFYVLYKRDFLHPNRASDRASHRTGGERSDSHQRDGIAADLFAWSPETDASKPPAEEVHAGSRLQTNSQPAPTPGRSAGDSTELPAKNPVEEVPKSTPPPAVPASVRVEPRSTEDANVTAAKQAAEERISQAMLAEQIALASTYQIPAGPRLRLGGTGDARPTQPINWEDDAKRAAEVAGSGPGAKTPEPTLLAVDEQFEIAEEKRKTREKISDIDVKLEMLVVDTAEDASRRRVLAEMEATRATTAADSLGREISQQRAELQRWEALAVRGAAEEPLKLSDDLAAVSPEVAESRRALQKATDRYAALEAAHGKNALAESELAAAGREKALRQAELKAAVLAELPKGPIRVKQHIARLQNDLHAVGKRRDLLNRHIGMLRAFVPATLARRQLLQQQYLKDRADLLKHLRELAERLSDEREARFRLEHTELFTAAG